MRKMVVTFLHSSFLPLPIHSLNVSHPLLLHLLYLLSSCFLLDAISPSSSPLHCNAPSAPHRVRHLEITTWHSLPPAIYKLDSHQHASSDVIACYQMRETNGWAQQKANMCLASSYTLARMCSGFLQIVGGRSWAISFSLLFFFLFFIQSPNSPFYSLSEYVWNNLQLICRTINIYLARVVSLQK